MAKQEAKPRKPAARGAVLSAKPPSPRELLFWGLLTSVVLSLLLTQGVLPLRFGPGIPEPGDIADRSYKAPGDIRIVDQEATAKVRRAAAEHAPLVYDFDERQRSVLRERVSAAFAAARAAAQATTGGETAAVSPAAAFLEALGEEELPEAAIRFLAEQGFSPEHEARLLQLLARVSGTMIVDDAAEFERATDRTLIVRELGSGEERRLEEKSRVLTPDSARELLREDATKLFPSEARAERQALVAVAESLLHPNLRFNLRASDEHRKAAEEGAQEVVITLRKGQIVVRDGDRVTERHVLILTGIRDQERTRSRLERFVGVSGLMFLLLVLLWRFGSSSIPRFPQHPNDARFLLFTLGLAALGTGLGIFLCDAVAESPNVAPWIGQDPSRLYYVIPVAAAAMLVRLVQSSETAALFSVLVSLLAGLQMGSEVGFAFYVLAGSLAAAGGVGRVTQRGTLLRAGVRVGIVHVAVIAALGLLQGQLVLGPLLISMALGFTAGLLSGMLVSAFAPVVETLFAYTTDIKLLELANREQVLLRELEFRAPGTYHHSMMVGHLAEKAAEAIGANALLAKVAGYYHDIGKMRRPHFFVENVTIHRGENRHEKLSPSMSARIIQAHVKDGLEFGEKFKLVPPIMRGIAEHHGTSVIRFFFEKAKDVADREKGELVEEHDYRYPGPRPQTREAGILMLADSVEAASRTLTDTSGPRVQQLVQRIINNYFRDGQLDECSLTLRDLHAIARSFIDTLSAIRHERIDYPEATDPEGRKLDEDGDEGVVERLEPGQRDRSERAPEERGGGLKRLGLP
ncbi:MAG: HD family phosphohydrolase [Myxococcota bacterium]